MNSPCMHKPRRASAHIAWATELVAAEVTRLTNSAASTLDAGREFQRIHPAHARERKRVFPEFQIHKYKLKVSHTMKIPLVFLLSVLSLGGWEVATAGESPKLAIAPVEATPLLGQRFAEPARAAAVPDSGSSGRVSSVLGAWRGTWHPHKGKPTQVELRLRQSEDGTFQAEVETLGNQKTWSATSAVVSGGHIALTLGNSGKTPGGMWTADVDPASKAMTAHWNRDKRNYPVSLKRTEEVAGASPAGSSPPAGAAPRVPSVSSLEKALHALDIQLADRLEAMRLFTVVDGVELNAALSSTDDKMKDKYRMKDPEVQARFKKAGIQYLLVTTVEDFMDETVDLAKGRVQTKEQTFDWNDRSQGWVERQRQWVRNQQKSSAAYERERTIHGSLNTTQSQQDTRTAKFQRVRLIVRARVYDATTGLAVQPAADYAFSEFRTNAVLSQGNNTISTSDMIDRVARKAAVWVAGLTGEGVFPIKVLGKDGEKITLNRGLDAGLQSGTSYNVYSAGKEIKDPDTGDILGNDEVTVGWVSISELKPKFSKATVHEDKGIAPGNLLRRR